MWNLFKKPLLEVEVIGKEEYNYTLNSDWGCSERYVACDLLVRAPNDEVWLRKFQASSVRDLSVGTKFKTTLEGWKRL